jgi:HEPN domain-containing protein
MALSYDPRSEVLYRVRLAELYLADAEVAYTRGDFRTTVASSQLAAENAAKAVIAVYRIPSWSHDPSHELREVADQVPETLRPLIEELADIAGTLAPEHGRATYGEPTRGLTPWDIYGRGDAERAVNYARRAVELMRTVLRELGVLGT